MRIVVIEPDGSGGLCHYAYMLSDGLARTGADVTLLTATDYELDHLPHSFSVDASLRLWPRIVPVTSVHRSIPGSIRRPARVVRRAWRALKLFLQWWRVTGRLRRNPPDVVQMRPLIVPGNRLILRRLAGTGAVVSQIVHELHERDETDTLRIVSRFTQSDFDSIDAVFFHNPSVRDQCLATRTVDPERTHIIPHGDGSIFERLDEQRDAELMDRYGLSADEKLVLMFGGVRASKGSDDLVRAFALLPANPHVKLLIAGPLSRDLDPDTLPALADDLGLGERATFDFRYIEMGEVAALMRLSDVVAFPYRSATQSGVLATAMTFGRPVVVTAVGGLPDIVQDGRAGFVVPPGDPARFAAAMGRVLDDPDLAAAMSKESLEMSRRFSWDEVASRVLGVYVGLEEQR